MLKFLCKIGFHKWELNRKLTAWDTFPPSFVPYENPIRKCKYCGKTQIWLPGYGGSELGCWIDENE